MFPKKIPFIYKIDSIIILFSCHFYKTSSYLEKVHSALKLLKSPISYECLYGYHNYRISYATFFEFLSPLYSGAKKMIKSHSDTFF